MSLEEPRYGISPVQNLLKELQLLKEIDDYNKLYYKVRGY